MGASARAARAPRLRNGFRWEQRAADRNWRRKSRALSGGCAPEPAKSEPAAGGGRAAAAAAEPGWIPRDAGSCAAPGGDSGRASRRPWIWYFYPAAASETTAPGWPRATPAPPRSGAGGLRAPAPFGAGPVAVVSLRPVPAGRAVSFGVYVNGR